MRVLLLGATGLLGRAVLRELHQAGIDVVGAGGSRAQEGILRFDAHDPASVTALFDTVRPDTVINAAGERRPEHWTARQLQALNVALPRTLARECTATGAWLIHISSDYVFDGRRPPHAPDGIRRPLNPYGTSKADGEDAVRRTNPEATTILRVPVLHGPVEYPGESNLSALVSLMASGNPMTVDDWAVRYPTATRDVAIVIRQMLTLRPHLTGSVCHWSATEPMTKYVMALAVARHLDIVIDHLQAERRPHPSRPRNPRLECRLLEGLGVGRRTPFAETLPDVVRSVLQQREAIR